MQNQQKDSPEKAIRRFSSYGAGSKKKHYFVPRTALVEEVYQNMLGDQEEGGHYITVWAPRQSGKTWLMREVLFRLKEDERFDVIKINLESLKKSKKSIFAIKSVTRKITRKLKLDFPEFNPEEENIFDQFQDLFLNDVLKKPLILILDEFDSLPEEIFNSFVSTFRNIYNNRQEDPNPSEEKEYLLHSVALIGVRSVLGVENKTGSPFNVQRSLSIPRLTYEETKEMFQWYERESGQKVEEEVIDQVYFNTLGQPGLVSWFGELLTEALNEEKDNPITLAHFDQVLAHAIRVLPNNTVLNIISKAEPPPYRFRVLDLFKTQKKVDFSFDDKELNYLFMNGVIDYEVIGTEFYCKFANPFIQKRLFRFFSRELFHDPGNLYDPFDELLGSAFQENGLEIKSLLQLYQSYLNQHREALFKDAPRRKTDLRIYEAIFHFNLYSFLHGILQEYQGRVIPEFPTGNGKIDLLLEYQGQIYGLELKSFSNRRDYQEAIKQAAHYGKQLQLEEIGLVFFVERIDEKNRQQLEVEKVDASTGVKVTPFFLEMGK